MAFVQFINVYFNRHFVDYLIFVDVYMKKTLKSIVH